MAAHRHVCPHSALCLIAPKSEIGDAFEFFCLIAERVTPLIVLVAIPFSLVGILPAHGLLGAFVSATSMIGFMAGAGIVVRNSIILVDFIEQHLAKGVPLVDAGAVRFGPMLLTAMAVVVGASVILADLIFRGLANRADGRRIRLPPR